MITLYAGFATAGDILGVSFTNPSVEVFASFHSTVAPPGE